MENKKRLVGIVVLTIIVALITAGCGSAPSAGGGGGEAAASGPAVFDNLEISALQARNAECGKDGDVYFFSGAKTSLESGTYEILLARSRAVSARGYQYLEFEIKADNMDLLEDIDGFFPRIRTGETYTQFNGSRALKGAIAEASGAENWIQVSVPIGADNTHELGDNLRTVLPRIDSLLFRFICMDMEPVSGKIYLRNFRFNN